MIILAKVGIGIAATMALATAWICHEGMIHIDVDEAGVGGSHVHFWVPATTVSVGLRVVPQHHLQRAAEQCRPYLPVLREVAKELEKYPNAELVEVRDAHDHVQVAMRNGKLYIDAVTDTDNVHVSFPVEVIRDVADRLEDAAPSI